MIIDFNAISVGAGKVSITTHDEGWTQIKASDTTLLGVPSLTIHYKQPEQARQNHRTIYRQFMTRGGNRE